jgi:outer membrane immunogenic protein
VRTSPFPIVARALVALAAFAIGGSARAADYSPPQWLPGSPPEHAAPQWLPSVPEYSWTGAYIGVNGGGVFGRSVWEEVPTGNFNVSGGLVGGTVGYNFQASSPLVIGVEADLDWSKVSGNTANNCFPNCETQNSWLGTARLRFGYAFDRFMPYVTGGYAIGDIRAQLMGGPLGMESTTRANWVIGGGLEFVIAGPVTGKLEYLYTDLGSMTCNFACGAAGPFTVRLKESIVRAGLNFRLWTK